MLAQVAGRAGCPNAWLVHSHVYPELILRDYPIDTLIAGCAEHRRSVNEGAAVTHAYQQLENEAFENLGGASRTLIKSSSPRLSLSANHVSSRVSSGVDPPALSACDLEGGPAFDLIKNSWKGSN
jgi:hypothetical protein